MLVRIFLAILIIFTISACDGFGGGDGCNPPKHWVKHWIHSDEGKGNFEYQVCE